MWMSRAFHDGQSYRELLEANCERFETRRSLCDVFDSRFVKRVTTLTGITTVLRKVWNLTAPTVDDKNHKQWLVY